MTKISDFYSEIRFKVNDEGLKELNSRIKTLASNLDNINSKMAKVKIANKQNVESQKNGIKDLIQEQKLEQAKHYTSFKHAQEKYKWAKAEEAQNKVTLSQMKLQESQTKKNALAFAKVAGSIYLAKKAFDIVSKEPLDKAVGLRQLERSYGIDTETANKWYIMAKSVAGVDEKSFLQGIARARANIASLRAGLGGDTEAFRKLNIGNAINMTDEELYEAVTKAVTDSLKTGRYSKADLQRMITSMGYSPQTLSMMQQHPEGLRGYQSQLTELDIKKLNALSDSFSELDSAILSAKDSFMIGLSPAVTFLSKKISELSGKKETKTALENLGESAGDVLVGALAVPLDVVSFASYAITDQAIKAKQAISGEITEWNNDEFLRDFKPLTAEYINSSSAKEQAQKVLSTSSNTYTDNGNRSYFFNQVTDVESGLDIAQERENNRIIAQQVLTGVQ